MEFNSSFIDDESETHHVRVHVFFHSVVEKDKTISTQKNCNQIVSLASADFSICLHQNIQFNEVLCKSLANTSQIASALYGRHINSTSIYPSFSEDRLNFKARSENSLLSIYSAWLYDLAKEVDFKKRIMRLCTSTMNNLLSLEPKHVRECYLRLVAEPREKLKTNENQLRYLLCFSCTSLAFKPTRIHFRGSR